MKSMLSRVALIATIVLKVIPAILEALAAFEKHSETVTPKRGAKSDS